METQQTSKSLIGCIIYESPLYKSKDPIMPDENDTIGQWLNRNTFGRYGQSERFMIGLEGVYVEIEPNTTEGSTRTGYHRSIIVKWQPLTKGIPHELLEALVERDYRPVERKE